MECWIGAGANLGDSRGAFDAAWERLRNTDAIQVKSRSGIYQTAAIGKDSGGTFSNAVFSLETSLAPLALLDLLQQIEMDLGRTRDVRWGPRPIDLDFLFAGQWILKQPRLTLPHPAAWYRRFVLDPLAEIAGDLMHPELKLSIADLRSRWQQRPLLIVLSPTTESAIGDIAPSLVSRFPQVVFCRQGESPAAAGIRLFESEPSETYCSGVPMADLTSTPGDPGQRVADFLGSALDEPERISDW